MKIMFPLIMFTFLLAGVATIMGIKKRDNDLLNIARTLYGITFGMGIATLILT